MSSLLPLIFACNNGPGNGNDDSGDPTDDSAEPVVYDEGCILVGDRGFAWLEDALVVVEEGGTIYLTECGDTFDQTATVTKSVNIVGPGEFETDLSALTWIAPTNEPALTISGASDVKVSGFTLISTRNGLVIDASTGVVLDSIVYQDIANTAIKATDSEITVTNSTFTAPQYGGVEISGGTADISGNTFDAPIAFGVHVIDDGVATVTDNAISATMYTDATEGISDGFGLFGDGGSIITEGNLFADNVVAVFVLQGDLTMSGDTISDGLFGVYAQFGAIDIDGVSVENPSTQGMYLVSQSDPVSLTNSSIYGDPELTFSTTDPDGWTGGAVTVATNDVATISNVEIEGYNAQGLLVVPYDDDIEVEMDTVTITNTGRFGLYVNEATATLTDVTVDGLRLVDDPDLVNQDYYEVGWGVFFNNSEVDWAGGGILDSEVIGLVGQYSAMSFDGITSMGHADVGLWSIYSTIEVRNSTLSSSPNYGGIANYYGDAIVEDNTFVDNQASWYFEYESYSLSYIGQGNNGNSTTGDTTFTDPDASFTTVGIGVGDMISLSGEPAGWNYVLSIDSDTQLTMENAWTADVSGGYYSMYDYEPVMYGYEYSLESLDLACVSGGPMEVRNNTFSTGSQGLYAQACEELVIEDNTWTDYARGYVLQFSSGTDAKLANNSIAGSGPYAFYCYDSTVEAEALSISEVDAATIDVTYTRDGEPDGGYSYSSSGVALYSSACTLQLSDVDISEAHYHAIHATESNLDFEDVEVTGGSDRSTSTISTVYAQWSTSEPYFVAEGLSITDPDSGAGMALVSSSSLGEGTIWLDELAVSGARDAGLDVDTLTAAISNATISGNGDGIISVGSALDLSDTELSFNAGWGYTASDWDGDGWSAGGGDCNDGDSSVNPDATEGTDFADDDCDGIADDGTDESDRDGDGYSIADGDCDDNDTTRYPGAAEGTHGIDSDCDGNAYDAYPSSLDASGLSAIGNGAGGLNLKDLSEVTLSSSSATGNTGYGLECSSSTTWTTCDTSDLSGNTDGEHDGCDTCD
ncbi:MAG TPA: right-handed parallel beta-helix repeat-containing protein [Myxococcota bacterium]|nr:right-handed parallel beta-helix repeat-containing protein [Myxococcota bacterium]